MVEAFSKDEIGVGHALLLARLQPAQQEEVLNACFREEWEGADQKPKRILLPVRQLQVWIERNVLLILKDAPFDRENPQLVPAAGSCLTCPKRTGHNKLLFAGVSENSDACSDPDCYAAKVDAHVKTTVAAKPKLIQITTAYGKPAEGSTVLPRNQYVEIRQDESKQKRDWPEYKTCKYTTDAIVAEGTEKGELRRVCAHAECPVHQSKKQVNGGDSKWKAEQGANPVTAYQFTCEFVVEFVVKNSSSTGICRRNSHLAPGLSGLKGLSDNPSWDRSGRFSGVSGTLMENPSQLRFTSCAPGR